MAPSTKELLAALQEKYPSQEVVYWKDGRIFVGTAESHLSLSLGQARKLVGIRAPARPRRTTIGAWGEWGWVAALHARRR